MPGSSSGTVPKRRRVRGQEQQATGASPTTKKPTDEDSLSDDRIKLVHTRFLIKNLTNVEKLAQQLLEYAPDVYRRVFNRGSRVETALSPADDNDARGIYGDGNRLARELRDDLNGLIEFSIAYGQVPIRIQMLQEQIAALEDIRSLLRIELRTIIQPIIQAEIRAALQEEFLPLLQSLPVGTAPAPTGEPEPAPRGLLTDVAPGAEDMISSLFDE
ncbi:hypothetical protein KSF_108260 [Reticulibacter mediterranei]|uniref:Uncharacterized protein n=1 Tax=Reticulibacter mediterranei TaxID=2778369 RepID=A0A8J3N9H1_9CHLR|nr:hypothetical protein KSF_108260 [Reticulibacter mediterranei]